jgi:membrane protein
MPGNPNKRGTWTRHWARARLVLSQALLNFFREDSLTISASIAYHTILSLFPLMLMLVGFSGLIIGRYELSGQLAVVLTRYLPMKPDFILRNLAAISHSYGRVTIISFALLLWSSSGVFLPLEKALNRAWDVDKGRRWWRSRLVALEMALVLGILIFISSALVGMSVFIHGWAQRRLFHLTSFPADFVYHLLVVAATFGLTLVMFLVLFQRLPNHPLGLSEVFPGAVLTGLFWEAARSLFTLLLPLFNYHHIYGSIGVVVALMTWAYISSAVILFGAQVSSALYRTFREDGLPEFVSARPNVPSPAGIP